MMKKLILLSIASLLVWGCTSLDDTNSAQIKKDYEAVFIPKSIESDKDKVMSKTYWDIWNKDLQKRIDDRIEKFRKSDATVKLDAMPNTPVEIEQKSHKFIFGAHIFNFNQLGKTEYNKIYKDLYGDLFNSATVAFYWHRFEMSPDKFRFETENWDTEDFWNNVPNPKEMPNWRRPPTDEVIEFCESKNIRIHGHPLIWGNRKWHHPESWLATNYGTADEKSFVKKYSQGAMVTGDQSWYTYNKEYQNATQEELEKRFSNLAKKSGERADIRVREIAKRYADKVDSWDVVNESARDFENGRHIVGSKLTKSHYGIMEADYAFNAFKLAQKYLPSSAKLNINDYHMKPAYIAQIKDLISRGCKIDIIGSQMHLFNPQQTLDLANGKPIQTPVEVEKTMSMLSELNMPIHLSEITITAAGTGEKERMMQAIALRNLYRLWFSIEHMMGITWWNVVDDCGAPGEPSMSGLFTRDMQPKPAYFAMNELINKEWKTNLKKTTDSDGNVSFRGFKGKYTISYTDKNGVKKVTEYNLN